MGDIAKQQPVAVEVSHDGVGSAEHAFVAPVDEAVLREKQEGRIEISAAERPHEHTPLRVVALSLHGVANLGSCHLPRLQIARQVCPLGESDAAVDCNPAHHFRLHEVQWRAAHLPDALIGFPPHLRCALDELGQKAPVMLCDLLASPVSRRRDLEHYSVDVVLRLFIGGVADTDGPRATEPVELQAHLGEPVFSAAPIHDL